MFDGFLRDRSRRTGEPFVPFDPVEDYDEYVDGKPRADGTRSFLASRGIELPEGSDDDPPGRGNGPRPRHPQERDPAAADHAPTGWRPTTARSATSTRSGTRACARAVVSSSANCRDVLARRRHRGSVRGADRRAGRQARAPAGQAGPGYLPGRGARPRAGAAGGRGVRGCAGRGGSRPGGGFRFCGRDRSGRAGRRPAEARRGHRRGAISPSCWTTHDQAADVQPWSPGACGRPC